MEKLKSILKLLFRKEYLLVTVTKTHYEITCDFKENEEEVVKELCARIIKRLNENSED